ncbi:MAG TPA: type II secretion system F family protein [Caulobacteraceae bacterium]
MTAEDLVDPANLIAAFAALLAFAAIVTVAAPQLRRDGLEVRLKSVASRREELRRKSREAMATQGSNKEVLLRRTDESLYKKVVERLQLSRLLEDPKVADRLAGAGFRGPRPISAYYFFRFALPFVFAAGAAFYMAVMHFDMAPMGKLSIVCGGFVAGFYAPNIYVGNLAKKRRNNIVLGFPDALDLLLICVEAGMSIEAALQKVSQEVGSASIELAEELSLLVAELSYLPERRMAYEGLGKRVNNTGVKAVVTAMIQAERYGTPLGSALRIMAKENRDLRLAAAEKKAAALPAQLTVPLILFLLPVLFVVIMAPAVIRTMAAWK